MGLDEIDPEKLQAALRVTGGNQLAAERLLQRPDMSPSAFDIAPGDRTSRTPGMSAEEFGVPAGGPGPRTPSMSAGDFGVAPAEPGLRTPRMSPEDFASPATRSPIQLPETTITAGGQPTDMDISQQEIDDYAAANQPTKVFGRMPQQPMAALPSNPYLNASQPAPNPYRRGQPQPDVNPDTLARARNFIDSQRAMQQPDAQSPTAGIDPAQIERVNQRLQDPTGLGPVTRKSVRALEDERIAGGNAGLGIQQQMTDNAAQTARDQGDIRGQYADQRAQNRGVLEQRGQAMTERTDANRQDQYAAAEKIRTLADRAPEEQRPGLKLAGDIISFIPFLSGIGRGMSNMASRATKEARQKWASDIGGQEARQNSDIKLNASEHDDFKGELTEAHALDVLRQTEQVDRFEQRALYGKSEEERLAGSLKFIDARDKLANYALGLQKEAEATRRKANQSLADTALLTRLAQTPEDQRAVLAAGYGPRGLDMLGKLQKPIKEQTGIEDTRTGIDQKNAGILKTGADINQTNAQTDLARSNIAKTDAETLALQKTGGRKLNEGEAKLARQAAGVTGDYKTLLTTAQDIAAKKPGADVPFIGIGPNASKYLASERAQKLNMAIQQLAAPLMYDASGAVISPEESQRKFDAWGFTSPDQNVRNQAPARLLAEFEARVGAVDPNLLQSGASPAAPDAGYSQADIEAELQRRKLKASR